MPKVSTLGNGYSPINKKYEKHGWWEKEWDRTFKKLLKDPAIIGPDIGMSFNNVAKQMIYKIIRQSIYQITQRHNLIVIAKDHSVRNNRSDIEKIKRLAKTFLHTETEAGKYRKLLEMVIKEGK